MPKASPTSTAPRYTAKNNAPDTPMKNELTAKAESLDFSGSTPMISAAMSMSRMAIHFRPVVPRVRLRAMMAQMVTKTRQNR